MLSALLTFTPYSLQEESRVFLAPRMDGSLQLGIAAIGLASRGYLRWRVRGDELFLSEGESAVKLRLGGE